MSVMPAVAALAVAFDGAELGGHAGVEDAHPLLAQQVEKPLGLLVANDELDLDGHVGREIEEMLLVQDAMAPEPSNGAKCRAARDAELLGLLEQPLEERDMVLLAVLVHVEAKQGPFHAAPQL